MKKLLLIVVLVPSLTFAQSKKQKKSQEKADKQTLARLKEHIQYLASDSLEGRRAGSKGEALAMQYISAEFKQAGLEPKGTEGYIQEFEINEGKQIDTAKTSLIVNDEKLELNKDYYPLAFSGNKSITGSASLHLRERGTPWFWDVKDILDDDTKNPHFDIDAAIYKEASNAASRGGKALIIFNSSATVDNILLNKRDTSVAVPIPVIYITNTALKKYFTDATDFYNIDLNVELNNKKSTAHNIIGYINNNAPATVIIGAHYDHVGYGEDNNTLDAKHEVHNGADDNASGTAALIELARMIKGGKAKNNNYLFIAFSGEELGLLGSKYWVENPTVNVTPNYMINLDMVGRYDADKKLIVGGYGTSPVWSTVTTATNKNLAIRFDSSGTAPSDNYTFYKKNIPVLYFFTNLHGDYHKTTDDVDKINYNAEVQIIRYVYNVIEATDSKGKLAFNKTRDVDMQSSVTLPVTLGVMPDYSYSGKGLRIEDVSKGKTADKIGLQQGDVLLQLGDYKFVDIQTYMQALQHFKKGDTTKLIVMRGDEEKIFDVEF